MTESCAPEFPSGVARSVPLAPFLLVENVLQLGDERGLERRFLKCARRRARTRRSLFSTTIVGLPWDVPASGWSCRRRRTAVEAVWRRSRARRVVCTYCPLGSRTNLPCRPRAHTGPQ